MKKTSIMIIRPVKSGFLALLFLLCLGLPSAALAQSDTRAVTGTVVGQDGSPLPGVNVLIKGTQSGTVCDAKGAFTLGQTPPRAILVFSFIGYDTRELSLAEVLKNPKIVLTESTTNLDEVVVVGYGAQKKASLTGAIGMVKGSEIMTTKNENITNMLAGKMSGVRVIQTSGEPGAFASSIQIRGFGAPLVVIDGVPRDNMTRLDPNEIESISVLKDASAAIYGVRASNGVILITTKRGKEGTVQIEYSGYYGIQTPINTPKGLSAAQFMEITNENNIMRGSLPYGQLEYSLEEIAKYRSGQKTGTEWWKINRDYYAPQYQHNVSMSGSAKVVDYFVNFSYLDQQGVYKSGDLNYGRYNLRSNLSAKLTKNLKAELLLGGMAETKNIPYADLTQYWETVWTAKPTTPAYANYDRRYMQNMKQGLNPLAITESDIVGYKRDKQKTFQATGNLIWDVPWVKNLQAKASYSYDFSFWEAKQLQRPYTLYDYNLDSNEYVPSVYGNTAKPGDSHVYRSTRFSGNTLMQFSLNYDRTFERHHVAALGLYEEGTTDMDNFYASRYIEMTSIEELLGGIDKDQAGGMDGSGYNPGAKPADQSGFWKIANKAVVGRVNYDFDSRYYGEFAFRYDGSSKFAPGHQWGFFPSVSVGWRISQEKFIKNNPALAFIDNLKLRASYGVTGDDATATFQFVPGYTYPASNIDWWPLLLDGQAVSMIGLKGTPNTNLTWYTSKTYNIGLDADFWGGKLGFEVDFFRRDRDGLVATRLVTLPDWLGESLAGENLNSDATLGFDLSVKHRNRIGKFSYGVTANVSMTRHKNVHVERKASTNQYDNWRNNGSNRYTDIWWGYNSSGQFKNYYDLWKAPIIDGKGNSELKPGDYKYEDWNGDGVIDALDEHPLTYGTVNSQNVPMMSFGMTIDAQYRGFDFAIVFQGGAFSNIMYDWYLARPFVQNMNGPDYFYDRWHMADPLADPKDPRTKWISGYLPTTSQGSTAMNMNSKASESTIHRTDYLRCKSIELGYTLPAVVTDWIGIKGARVYVNAYNLFTLTGLKYLDPEHPSSGYGTTYPLIRTINFGANIKF